jgi:ribosomal protein S18 acetylase RimI-like enzyme
MWEPDSGEVIIVGDWRRWPGIASVAGLHALRNIHDLYRASIEQCRESGADAYLAIEWDEQQQPEFYRNIGLELLDVVIPFEAPAAPYGHPATPAQYLAQLDIRGSMTELLQVDNAAFPWLWVNNAAEFLNYAETPGVEVWGHLVGGRLVSYVGFTYFGNWGHIDRIAVHPDAQQQGLGAELMRVAMHRLASFGTRTVGLSTQASNWKSQRLYDQLGFRRSSMNAYRVYGRVFRPALIEEFAPPA